MDFSLTSKQRELQERFAPLCRGIAARAAQADRTSVLPPENWKDLAAAGYFGLFHPKEIGGAGADGVTLAIAMECLGRACASTLWSATISTALAGKALYELAGPRQHERWLGGIVKGERIGCFAITEHGAGSDPGSYATTLRKTPHGYRLRGEKSRISNASVADVAVVVAYEEGSHAQPSKPMRYAVVDLRAPGVRRVEQAKMGLSAMSWGTVTFDDVEVDPQDILFDADMTRVLKVVEWGQLLQCFGSIGLAEAALDAATAHVKERNAFGRPLAHLQPVHGHLAEMRIDIDASRLLALEAAWRKGQGETAGELVMMAKVSATEMAVRVADTAMRLFGGWGYSKDQPIERIYRDALGNVPAGLPTDRLRELLACPMVGVSPWTYEPFDWLSPSALRV
jgi:alkylation response protein AidB-like acyl-CoA dehydrogenase